MEDFYHNKSSYFLCIQYRSHFSDTIEILKVHPTFKITEFGRMFSIIVRPCKMIILDDMDRAGVVAGVGISAI